MQLGHASGGGKMGDGRGSRGTAQGNHLRSVGGHEIAVRTLMLLLLLQLINSVAAQPGRSKSPPAHSPSPRKPSLPSPPRPPQPRPLRPPPRTRPNFVVIVTDDQDDVLNSTHPAYMPALNALVGAGGIRFANTLVSTSVCCPARVSLFTGRLAHCTNITANWAPMGAWLKFSRLELDSDWLPVWLQEAGYRTALVGKLLNGFSIPLGGRGRCPLGIEHLDALTEGTYNLYNSSFSFNCGPSKGMPGQYQTDVIRDKALSYLDSVAVSGAPFYLHLTPTAPHVDNGAEGWRPPPPALRHEKLYPNVGLPANPTFLKPNPLNPYRTLDMSKSVNVQTMTELYVGRLRSLRAVDEMVEAVVKKLSDLGILNNTYIFYMSDNGLHMGQHGMDDGKATPVEEDSRVPLYLSGPGIPAGVVSAYQANLIDFAPTILALAGLEQRPDVDGIPLPLEGLTTNAYSDAMHQAVIAAAARAGFLPPSPPPSPPLPPSPPSPSPKPPRLPRINSRILFAAKTSLPPLQAMRGPEPQLQSSANMPSPPHAAPPRPQPSAKWNRSPRPPSVPKPRPALLALPTQSPPSYPRPRPRYPPPSSLLIRPPLSSPPSGTLTTMPSPLIAPPPPPPASSRVYMPLPSSTPALSPYPFPPILKSPASASLWFREAVILEAWDSDAKTGFFPGVTFKGLRLCSTYQPDITAPRKPPPPSPPPQQRLPPVLAPQSPPQSQSVVSRPPALMVPQPTSAPPLYCLKYVVWCKGSQRELYDLSSDPYEVTDVLGFAPAALLNRLDAVLSVLVHCRGMDCAHPYGVLHPAGDVVTFTQAMDPRYDDLYASLPRFTFATCYPGYVPANERTFTLGIQGFPANVSWNSTGIVWPLPPGVRGIKMEPGE